MTTCAARALRLRKCALDLKTKPTPPVMYFLSMNLTWSAREVSSKLPGEFIQWLPYYLLIALVILTGWYQVRQTQARQLSSGGAAPNSQMQAVTKIMPLFFGLITFSLNAATTFYFVVSNVWRIGQQHLVLGKMYEEQMNPPKTTKPPPALDDESPPADGKTTDGKTNGKKPTGSGSSPPTNGAGGASRPSEHAARKKKKRKR